MLTPEDYFEAESKARDILSSDIEFGDEMSPELESALHFLTLEVLNWQDRA